MLLDPARDGVLCIRPIFCLWFVIVAAGLTAVPRFASGQVSSEFQSGSTAERSENTEFVGVRSNDAVRMPVVSFKTTSSLVDEEAHPHSTPVSIEITIDPPPTDRFELNYGISEQSTAGGPGGRNDYALSPYTSSPLQVLPMDDSAEIRLSITSDWYAEEDETIILILQPGDPDDPKYTLGSNSVHTVTIESGDPTIISDVDFHRGEDGRTESALTWDITVSLSNGMYLGDDGNLTSRPRSARHN